MPPETCPKCGAAETWRHALQIQYGCDSRLVDDQFRQSDPCIIAELTATVAELREELADKYGKCKRVRRRVERHDIPAP